MTPADDPETILTDLRTRLADLLSHAPARDRFREKVAAYCKRLVEAGRLGAAPVDTGVATCFGSVGSLAMIAALMKRGPQNLDEAYVLLGAIHDAGPHVGRAGQASPPEWDTDAQSVSGEEDRRILDWAQHAEWHSVINLVNTPPEAGGLTPEVKRRLPAWLEKVRAECAEKTGSENAKPVRNNLAVKKVLPPHLEKFDLLQFYFSCAEGYQESMRRAMEDQLSRIAIQSARASKDSTNASIVHKAIRYLSASASKDGTADKEPVTWANLAETILRDVRAFERLKAAHVGRSWLVQEGETRELLERLASWAELMDFNSHPFTNLADLVHDEPRPTNRRDVPEIASIRWGEAEGLIRRMRPTAKAWRTLPALPAQGAGRVVVAAPKAAAPSPSVAPPAAKGGKAVDLQKQSLDTRACGALAAHQGWTNTQIAVSLGCARTSLNRLPGFMRARGVQKAAKKENLRRGHWDKERGQSVPHVGDEDEDGREVSED